MHHLNNWGLEQDKNGESASPRARWGEATFKGVVVVWSETMYISGVIARWWGYWHTLVMLCKFLLEKKKTWHPNGLKSLNVVGVILNFGHLIHLLDFDVLEKDPAWIAYGLCWACAAWCLDTVSNPDLKDLPLVQRAKLWPAVYQ